MRDNPWPLRVGIAAGTVVSALAVTHALWSVLRYTPFLLGLGAAILSSRVGGRWAGFLSVFLGVIGYTLFPLPVQQQGFARFLPGFVLVAGTSSWVVARRYEFEAVVSRSERRLQTIIEAEPACVKLVSHDGLLLEMNRAGLKMLGAQDVSQVIGMRVLDLVHPEDWPKVADMHRIASGGVPSRLEFRLHGLDGTERWVESHAVPFDASNHTGEWQPAVLSVTSDITDRKRLEDQLRHSQKMEAIGLLAGGIAHDFNNLLTAIGGYTELALRATTGREKRREHLQEVAKAANRAAALTRQLLAVSHRQILQTTIMDLNALVADMEQLLRRTIPENIDFRLELSPVTEHIRADHGQMEQVVLNLVINAADAMSAGGQLRVVTAAVNVDEGSARLRPPMPPGRYVRLLVRDTGVGMTAETQARIFEPFFTTKERGKGTGLGLATVYGIVKQSGGYIWVESEVGRHTTFEVFLPVVHELPPDPVTLVPAPEISSKSQTIVLAEDDGAVRRLASDVLTSHGYTVLAARDGDEALETARRHPGPIHLLIADVVMPGLSGPALATQLKEERPNVPVLYTSGYTENVMLGTGFEHGLALLGKPFLPADLLWKVDEILAASDR
jgi:PAS domain S-box-containing protein